MSAHTLATVAADLEAHGINPGQLRQLDTELTELDAPPGFLRRMARALRNTVAEHWSHLVGEVRESVELVRILRKAATPSGRRSLTDTEVASARQQLGDLLRMAPASAVFMAIELIPVPGTSVVTPWVLLKLGLLPSRWREAHLLAGLRTEASRLRDAHADANAATVDSVADAVEARCRLREQAAHDAALLAHWDADGNGRWDPEERIAYDAALDVMVGHASQRTDRARKRWFLQAAGHVFGPFALTAVLDVDTDVPLLVCRDAEGAWIDLSDLRQRLA